MAEASLRARSLWPRAWQLEWGEGDCGPGFSPGPPRRALLDLDALLLEVLQGTRVPRHAGAAGGLPLRLDVERLLVHQRQVVTLLQDHLGEIVRQLVVHAGVDGDDVPHRV